MRLSKLIFLSFLFLFIFQFTYAQEKKPKVALVLSGGGAKGVAHIPTLQMLDSLGIVPDLVIGTSMGSIVGGLYAMGYSGDEIEKLTKAMAWDELFGGKVSLLDISNEEKSEYEKYLVDFDFEKGKPKVGSGIISDQNLREYLHSVTYPVYNITDFDELAIPYRAMATDIVNGKEVILDKGSLNFAMRASMSIPAVFLPVEYGDMLLVDGGVLNNFPTDVAKSMGADIIIGSDVGGGMQPKEELNNIVNLLFQTGMLSSNLKNPGNRELCAILIDHVGNLTYGTGDFDKAIEIYDQGKIATNTNKQAFVDLAEKLKGYKQREHALPPVKDEFVIPNINYKGISEQNLSLVKARSNFKAETVYSTKEINEGIDKIVGTNIFDRISYNIQKDDKGLLNLDVTGFEKSKHQVKGSIHFDNERGIGLLLNYTGRNVIGNSSRILITADVATEQRLRAQYQNIFGEKKQWWFRSEWFSEYLNQEFTISGDLAEDFKYRYSLFDNEINKNLKTFHSYLGLGISYESTRLKPEVDPDIQDNLLDLERYQFKSYDVYAHYVVNTMNQVFYPTAGTYFKTKLSQSVYNDGEVNFSDEAIEDLNGSFGSITKLSLDYEKRFPIRKKMTAILGATGGFTFYNDPGTGSDDLSYSAYGYGSKYYLGGVLMRPRKDNYIFQGLNEAELPVTQFMMVKMSLQYNIAGKIFLIPHVNLASVGFKDFSNYVDDAFTPEGSWDETSDPSAVFSAGITASMNSFLGPIDFDISYINDVDKIRLFFGIGLQFNRSN